MLSVLAWASLVTVGVLSGCSSHGTAPSGPDHSKAVEHLQEAKKAAGANRIADALTEAKQAREADPSLAEAYTMRADLYSRSAHFREARDELLAAHKALPNDLDVTMALLYDTQYYFPPAEAEALARKAVQQDANSAEAHYFVGLAIVNGGDPKRHDEALKEFETASRLNPTATTTLVEIAKLHLQMGNAQRARDLLASAALILDEAKKQGPMPVPVLQDWTRERRAVAYWTADALRRLKKPAESKAAAALANKLSKQSSELRALQARVAATPPDPTALERLREIAAKGF